MSLTNPSTPTRGAKNYFSNIKLACRLAGVSLKNNDSIGYKVYSFLVFVPFISMYMILHFKEMLKSDADNSDLTRFFFAVVLASLKGIYSLMHRIKIGKLLDKFEQEPFLPDRSRGGEIEEKLIEKCVWVVNVQAYTYWMFLYTMFFLATCASITPRIRSNDYEDWQFTLGRLTVLNITYSPNYEISWLYQTLTTTVLVGQVANTDLLTVAMLVHISFHFQILQNYIKQIPRISYETMMRQTAYNNSSAVHTENVPEVPWKYLQHTVSGAVKYHLAILGIAMEIEALFKRLQLLIFLSTLATLGYLLYNVSKIPITDVRVFIGVGEVVAGCVQVLVVCYWGEQMTFQSQEVGRAAYETDFVGTDLKFQKALALIIRRSQKPVVMTANNFAVIGLPIFLWITRTSYSTYMALRRLQN